METKKELSYFRLKLENYLSEHFPEMLSDKPFITGKSRRSTYLLLRCCGTRLLASRS